MVNEHVQRSRWKKQGAGERIPHIFICAGETSGDMHAASVIQALKSQSLPVSISGICGPAMRKQGCNELVAMESLNVMGLWDVLRALPRIHRIGQEITDWATMERPQLAILVDFPGFNMRLGSRLRKLGIPVLYYIAPKLWAWGKWRVSRLRHAQDYLACILPFEPKWFEKHGIAAEYVGNPSAWACKQPSWSQQELRQYAGINNDGPLLALLPGSRHGELARHAPLLAEVCRQMRVAIPDLQIITCRAPGVSDHHLQPLIDENIIIVNRLHPQYALRADAAVAVSGTATLELALWGTPTILVYRNTPLTIWLARKLVGTQCAGLANIILNDQAIMPELIQEQATPEKIVFALKPLIHKEKESKNQRDNFAKLQNELGNENPAVNVACMALNIIKNHLTDKR